jgi:hypothetical protein
MDSLQITASRYGNTSVYDPNGKSGKSGGDVSVDEDAAVISPAIVYRDEPEPVATSTLKSGAMELPSPLVPYEVCWLILEELLGSYAEAMERQDGRVCDCLNLYNLLC